MCVCMSAWLTVCMGILMTFGFFVLEKKNTKRCIYGSTQLIHGRWFKKNTFKKAAIYPLSDRQLENLRAVFGRGVKKRNGRRLAGNPADCVNTLAGEFWVSLRMVW